MKKAFGQTVRDLKRGVNKKVLKVPGIEQKVLDATSNESWGPHGSLLAEIANASRNYHEYQLTMGVLWKRLSDTGKNWRHVYKALIVLEYMVGHGSERVIEEIKERAYQISTLSGFQYVDSSGKDQGSNVRKKSQSLVALVNDKERIAEIREKAAANRDKYHNSTSGGMHRPSGGYGDKYDYDGQYGDRDEGRSSYGREREYSYKDDDRNSRDGDRQSRDSEDRYGRDGNRDDEYHGRSRSVDNYQYGSRGRSSDRERPIEDDGQSSSRGSGARADDHSQDGRGGLERKFSEQNIGGNPPSYEEAVSESRSPVYSERDGGEIPQVAPPVAAASPPAENISVENKAAGIVNESPPQQVEAFDEFDPRGSVSAGVPTAGASAPAPSPPIVVSTSAPPSSNNAEMDLLGSLSDVFSPNPLAIVTSDSTFVETNGLANTGSAPSFSTSQSSTQPFDDPFGDSPFKAITSADTDGLSQHQSFGAPFQPIPPTSNPDNGLSFGFGEAFSAVPNPEPGVQNMQASPDASVLPQEQFDTSQSEIDILAGILPPSGPPVSLFPQPNPSMPTSQFPPSGNNYEGFHHQATPTDPNMPGQTPFGQASQQYNMVSHSQNHPGGMQFNNGGFMQQPGYAGSATSSSSQPPYPTTPNAPAGQFDGGNFMTQQAHGVTQQLHGFPSHIPQRTQSGPVAAPGDNKDFIGDMFAPAGLSSLGTSASQPSLTPLTGAIEIVAPQSQKKFEPKSTIWADTLSRGLVNFNISGPKTNPLSDIGVDFEAINRKEKRLEKPTAAQQQVTSTINMGKAMGSGTGLGRAGAVAMRPPTNSMVGPGMPMPMGMNVGGYGGMNQNHPMGMNQNQAMGMGMNQNHPMGMNHNHPMGMNQNYPMGMGMNMNMGGYGQGYPLQPQQGMGMAPPGAPPGMTGAYNPMMGQGGYNPQQQQPYGGGYR
ncbi:Clathrin interactor EPSIN 3 [Cardamine amara subsp. amara]|uniref:Clathrin interactor EPSIN 3 n=1 Tax=Cardamine amara subsp. amara TaxID=228776 RepID=A0ABD0ZEV1_CARAN